MQGVFRTPCAATNLGTGGFFSRFSLENFSWISFAARWMGLGGMEGYCKNEISVFLQCGFCGFSLKGKGLASFAMLRV